MRRAVVLIVVAAGVAVVALDVAPAPYVLGPLVGFAIWRFGTASFRTLRQGADHIPDGSDPQPVDLDVERVSYWCEGCGTGVLLLVRGTPVPPRHCGERMEEHHDKEHTALE